MKIVSWNVKGLHSPNKRMAVLRHLKRLKADIALLLETHLTASDFVRMRKLWVGQVFGSPAVKGKAGDFLLIHKNLPCEGISVQEHSEGRTLTARIKTSAREWAISNVYVPSSHSKLCLHKLISSLAPYPQLPLLVAGDFNSVLDNREDRSPGTRNPVPPPQNSPTPLQQFADGLQVVDLWGLTQPEGREYTFFSPPHNSLSRIDYTFLNPPSSDTPLTHACTT